MNPEIHERACRFLDALHVEGIDAEQREWLKRTWRIARRARHVRTRASGPFRPCARTR